jgi:hypothetical protein
MNAKWIKGAFEYLHADLKNILTKMAFGALDFIQTKI